jgi:hypothetical protein
MKPECSFEGSESRCLIVRASLQLLANCNEPIPQRVGNSRSNPSRLAPSTEPQLARVPTLGERRAALPALRQHEMGMQNSRRSRKKPPPRRALSLAPWTISPLQSSRIATRFQPNCAHASAYASGGTSIRGPGSRRNSSAAINGKIVVSIGALKPLPHHPQQYPEQCEACGKAKREVNCVGAHVGAPRKQ